MHLSVLKSLDSQITLIIWSYSSKCSSNASFISFESLSFLSFCSQDNDLIYLLFKFIKKSWIFCRCFWSHIKSSIFWKVLHALLYLNAMRCNEILVTVFEVMKVSKVFELFKVNTCFEVFKVIWLVIYLKSLKPCPSFNLNLINVLKVRKTQNILKTNAITE